MVCDAKKTWTFDKISDIESTPTIWVSKLLVIDPRSEDTNSWSYYSQARNSGFNIPLSASPWKLYINGGEKEESRKHYK